jgi:hypothetical protein
MHKSHQFREPVSVGVECVGILKRRTPICVFGRRSHSRNFPSTFVEGSLSVQKVPKLTQLDDEEVQAPNVVDHVESHRGS